MADFAGKGTQLHIAIQTTFIPISQNVEISGPSGEMGTREVTHLDSAAREFRATIVDSGELTGNCLFDPTNPAQSYFQSRALGTTYLSTGESFRLYFSSTAKFEAFNGIPTRWAGSGYTVDGTATKEWGIKVSGLVTVATTT
jgi:hypothetical protein